MLGYQIPVVPDWLQLAELGLPLAPKGIWNHKLDAIVNRIFKACADIGRLRQLAF